MATQRQRQTLMKFEKEGGADGFYIEIYQQPGREAEKKEGRSPTGL